MCVLVFGTVSGQRGGADAAFKDNSIKMKSTLRGLEQET